MTTFVDDVVRVSCEGFNAEASQQYVNVFHYRMATVVDGNDATVSDELRLILDAVWAAIPSIINERVGISLYRMSNESQLFLYNDQPSTFDGTSLVEGVSSQVAALVVGRTRTTRVQGRKYVGGLAEDQVALAGRLEAGALTALENYADAYINTVFGLSGNEYVPGVWRPPTITPPAAGLFTDFSSRRVIPATRTQRTRTQTLVLQ